jgi:hypothetical protein
MYTCDFCGKTWGSILAVTACCDPTSDIEDD